MVDLMLYQDGSIHWNIIFTRPIQDWEVELVSSFFNVVFSRSKARRCGKNMLDPFQEIQIQSKDVLSCVKPYLLVPRFRGRVFRDLRLIQE